MSTDEKWIRPDSPTPPMFVGEPERNYQKQISDEIFEDVVGQQILYFAVDIDKTKFHPLYKEAINKMFFNPIRIFASIDYEDNNTTIDKYGKDRRSSIKVHFPKKRITDDQNLFVREGDFIYYNSEFHEIAKLEEPKELYGNIEHKIEITAVCVKARSAPNVSNRG